MNVDYINVKAGERTSFRRCNWQNAANGGTVIGSQGCNKRVQFAETDAYCEDSSSSDHQSEDESLDSTEHAQRRSQIWYTEEDYEDFKSDRLATIRMFNSLQGDMDEVLEDFYCLRGLEPFHSPSLQSELCVHRAIYVNAVLSEQRRAILQKIRKQILSGGEENEEEEEQCLAVAIRHRIEHVSKWSMQRAQRLAVLDEIEAKKISGRSNNRRASWASTQEGKRRRCDGNPSLLQNGVESKKSFAVTSQVNLLELKEMNRRLCEEMGVSNLRSIQVSQLQKNSVPESDVMSLNSLMQANLLKTKCEALFPPLPLDYLQHDLSAINQPQRDR